MNRAIKQFVVSLWRTVVPRQARNSLRLWLMLDMPDRAPQPIDDFSQNSVLVLAPHMDDEIIGPGGTIARHVQSGSAVTFVFMTDGMAGDPTMAQANLSPEQMAAQNRQYAQTRKNESRRAAEIIGVRELIFLDGPDGALADTDEITVALANVFAERKPVIVYVPALTDNHADHWATNRILRRVLDRLSPAEARNLLIRGYEIWTPTLANRMADITTTADVKKQAIDAFVSQTKLVDYARSIIGLNQYRSMMWLQGRGYAEAFLETTAAEHRELFDRISLKHGADGDVRQSGKS